MIKIFRKKENHNLYSPISGLCKDIIECNDKTFSSKVMGDGFFVDPIENTVLSPCDGKVVAVFPTKHAIGIEMSNQCQIILHVGIDTVKLGGKFFDLFVSKGDKVKAGQKLLKFDLKEMKERNIDVSTIVVLLESEKYSLNKGKMDRQVNAKDLIVSIDKVNATT
ncbi:MAG: PTS glucose transporter subunit IIA [Longicatena sp.]